MGNSSDLNANERLRTSEVLKDANKKCISGISIFMVQIDTLQVDEVIGGG